MALWVMGHTFYLEQRLSISYIRAAAAKERFREHVPPFFIKQQLAFFGKEFHSLSLPFFFFLLLLYHIPTFTSYQLQTQPAHHL